ALGLSGFNLTDQPLACFIFRILRRPLTGNWRTYWRYRVGDYRVVCEIRDNELVIVAVLIGHRSEVYG
ncbi:type II toxin-antitoxin system RelE family toxin, partial [Aeromonas caviae]